LAARQRRRCPAHPGIDLDEGAPAGGGELLTRRTGRGPAATVAAPAAVASRRCERLFGLPSTGVGLLSCDPGTQFGVKSS
jgi:hypothetical protein